MTCQRIICSQYSFEETNTQLHINHDGCGKRKKIIGIDEEVERLEFLYIAGRMWNGVTTAENLIRLGIQTLKIFQGRLLYSVSYPELWL